MGKSIVVHDSGNADASFAAEPLCCPSERQDCSRHDSGWNREWNPGGQVCEGTRRNAFTESNTSQHRQGIAISRQDFAVHTLSSVLFCTVLSPFDQKKEPVGGHASGLVPIL